MLQYKYDREIDYRSQILSLRYICNDNTPGYSLHLQQFTDLCTFVHIVVRYDANKSMSLRVQYESGNFRKYYATLINWQMDHTNAGSCLLIFFCQMRDVGIDQAVVMVTPLDHPP